MKFSKNTVELLKNFARINPKLRVQEGNTVRTKNASGTVYGCATIEESLPKFALYDLNKFLSVIDGLYNSPDLDFKENYVGITSIEPTGAERLPYYFCEEELVEKCPEFEKTEVVNAAPIAEFRLPASTLERLTKCSNTISVKEIRFVGTVEGNLCAIGYDTQSKENGHQSTHITIDLRSVQEEGSPIVQTEADGSLKYVGAPFDVHISLDRLLMLKGDYRVSVMNERMIKAVNINQPLVYVLALTLDVDNGTN